MIVVMNPTEIPKKNQPSIMIQIISINVRREPRTIIISIIIRDFH